ncbi:MAG: ABC transporter substrate-binding protein [Clostridiales bacterium]|nr:ABC transporter substrate-binding protein [Clostridiales bacterium]
MKKITGKMICAVLVLAVLLSGCASSAAENTSESGSISTVASTSVAICEILDALGFDNVVGVPETENELPERYSEVATIGSPMSPDTEVIKSIAPDLVLSPATLESSLSEEYETAGINSAFLDLSSVEGMYKGITSLGELLGCEDKAAQLNAEYDAYMESYTTEIDKEPSILLLMCFPDGFYLVATENSYVGSLVSLAGGRNVYDESYSADENGFVSINPEDIVQTDPDKILVFAHYSEEDAFEYMRGEFESDSSWQFYDAVTEEEIYYLPSEYFGMSASLDWTEGLDYLKTVLYDE